MIIKVESRSIGKVACDVLIVGVYEDKEKPLHDYLQHEKFKAQKGDASLINTQGGIPAVRICFVGLGKSKEINRDTVRNACAMGAKKAICAKAKNIAVYMDTPEDMSQAAAEGIVLGSYKFQGFHKKIEEEHKLVTAAIIVSSQGKVKAAQEAVKFGNIIATAENRVRDLTNCPSNVTTPEYLAAYAKQIAKETKVTCKILDPEKENMECIMAVAKGSDILPKVVVLSYKGSSKKELTALVGKGVTFDSGGISLKPSAQMWEMKGDMAGAAAVIEAMRVIAKLGIPKNIVAVIPLTENMPSGHALKPGDVIGSLDGTTVEIISTDAEGRLILADAITYAKKLGAARIFDCATLTGGCVTALGDVASGLMGNDEKMIDEVLEAAEKSGEKAWHLPLYEEYKDYLKSSVADIKNCMDRGKASPSTGGTFLHKFVGDTPWVHLDIAGTAYLSKARPPYAEGATGVPLRTMIEWLRS